MNASVLILGAAGFIGTALRTALAPQYRLICVDQAPLPDLPTAPANEESHQLDMGRPDHIDDLFERLGPDIERLAGVIDLVAYYDFKNEPDPRYEAVERGLEYFLEQAGPRLPSGVPFVYASSMAAMAPTEPGRAQTPESPRLGAWQYPAHKLRCERILEAADIPQPRVELVLAAVYSPWCELVPLFQQIERVRRRSSEALFYPGPSERGLTYVHVDDAADAFRRALEAYAGKTGVHRLLVGEERSVTYAFIHRVASMHLLGSSRPIFRVPRVVARAGAAALGRFSQWRGHRRFVMPWMVSFAGEHFEFNINDTRRTLGWVPQHDLARELEAICDRARSSPDEWLRRNEVRPW